MRPQDIRSNYVDKMGETLGIQMYHLRNFFIWTKGLWVDYLFLYFDKEDRVKLLNSTAPNFFANHQRLLRDAVSLNLSKLVDPAKDSRKNINISFNAVYEIIDPKLRDRLEPELHDLKELTRHLSMHRNKRIAHFDYLTQESISKAEIKQSMKSI